MLLVGGVLFFAGTLTISFIGGVISAPFVKSILMRGYYYAAAKWSKWKISKYIYKCNYKDFRNHMSFLKRIDDNLISTNYYNDILDLYDIDDLLVNSKELFEDRFDIKKRILKELNDKEQREIVDKYLSNHKELSLSKIDENHFMNNL